LRLFVPPRERIVRRMLRTVLRDCRSVLDVGCGQESPLAVAGFGGFAVGVDVSWSELRVARARRIHTALVRADAATVERVFRPRAFDAVLALDVIEHLERGAALGLIAALETLARRRVVILTPNGFVAQPPAPANPHQEHRSGFTVRDMRRLGYRVRGIRGLKRVCGSFAEAQWRPAFFWRRIADLAAPLAYLAPGAAFALFCVKEVAPGTPLPSPRHPW
jgi:predicted TPR repeat methyltransferase